MSITDELERLQRLREQGALSDEEFQQAKQRVLEQPGAAGWLENIRRVLGVSGLSDEEIARNWAMHLHLSQLLGYAVPILGLVVPILIWQIKRTDIPDLDRHGRIVLNWIVTSLIGLVVLSVLAWFLIGIPLLFIWGLLCVLFPLFGAYKASQGQVWQYPLAIRFV